METGQHQLLEGSFQLIYKDAGKPEELPIARESPAGSKYL